MPNNIVLMLNVKTPYLMGSVEILQENQTFKKPNQKYVII